MESHKVLESSDKLNNILKDIIKTEIPQPNIPNLIQTLESLDLPLWQKIGIFGYCQYRPVDNASLDKVFKSIFKTYDAIATNKYTTSIKMHDDETSIKTLLEEEALVPSQILMNNSLDDLLPHSKLILGKIDDYYQHHHYKFSENIQSLDLTNITTNMNLFSIDDCHKLTEEFPNITKNETQHLVYKERFHIRFNSMGMHKLKLFYPIFDIFANFLRKIHCSPVKYKMAVINDSQLKPGVFTEKLKIILMTMLAYELQMKDTSLNMNFLYIPKNETLELSFFSSIKHNDSILTKKRIEILLYIESIFNKVSFWEHDYSYSREINTFFKPSWGPPHL